MMSHCDLILERTAAGEPLSDDQQAHVAGCVDCARLARVPGLLAAAAAEPDPGPGFASRMQIGARGRLAVRRRNRVALASFAAAAVLTAGGLAFTRPSHRVGAPGAMTTMQHEEPTPRPPVAGEQPRVTDDDIKLELVRVAHTERSLAGEADWDEITHDLIPYRALLAKQRARKGAPR